MVFDQFPKCRFAAERPTWTAQYEVAVRKEAGQVGWRERRRDGEDMPYILCRI